MNRVIFQFLALSLVALSLTTTPVMAQSTEFTYQGRLLSGDVPANGNHDFEFTLWDAETTGNQIGSVITLTAVNVNNGVFSVRIDFGNQFPGANRFLEIKVRQSGSGATFTTLAPRQAVSSSPYAIKSINAENAANARDAELFGGLLPNRFVQITDTRLTDARTPLPNSPNYIQNTTIPQLLSNFNISGNGVVGGTLTADTLNGNGAGLNNLNAFNITIGTLNSARLGTIPVGKGGTGLTAPGPAGSFLRSNGSAWISSLLGSSDIPAGSPSYIQNTTTQQPGTNFSIGGNGTVGGTLSGNIVTATTQFNIGPNRILMGGAGNLIAGVSAGSSNAGDNNAFFGFEAGHSNTSGFNNSFFGDSAGQFNTTGDNNTFIGSDAGRGNTTGTDNTYVGIDAGTVNTTGGKNTFVGSDAGTGNTTGGNNTFVGSDAGGGNTTGLNNTFVGRDAGAINMAGSNNTAIGSNASFGIVNNANYATAIGAGAVANGDDLLVLGKFAGNYDGVARPADRVFVRGTLTVFSLADGTSTTMCRSANTLSFCSSSIRYKENINSFSPGLSLVKQLRPVSFTWKSNGSLDFGLVAEEVAKVEPLLITRNDKGDIEGVKYERVGVVLLNAVNEQQQQIDSQQRKIEAQQKQLQQQSQTIRGQQAKLDAMKKFICSKNPKAELCRPKD